MATIAVIGEIVAGAVLPPDGVVNGVAHLAVHPGGGPANTAVPWRDWAPPPDSPGASPAERSAPSVAPNSKPRR